MKAVLFDFGGTIDTNGIHWSEKYWDLYEEFGVGVSKERYEESFRESERLMAVDERLRSASMRDTIRIQLGLQFATLKLTARDEAVEKMAASCYRDIGGVIRRAGEMLRRLKKSYALGVVSNFYGNLEVVCREFGLTPLFDAIVDSAIVGVRKPDPAIFAHALRILGIEGRDAYMVGDSYDRDIAPAKSLGCSTIWLKGKSWTQPRATDAADFIITSFGQISDIINVTE